jgi:Tol biopolymer transport system component
VLIVDSSQAGFGGEHYLVPLAGGSAIQLEPASSSTNWAWSPDGNRLAYRPHRQPDLYVYDRSTHTRQLLATDLSTKTHRPLLWISNGRQILAGESVFDVPPGAVQSLPFPAESIVSASEAPDGRHLIVSTQVSDDSSCRFNSTYTYLFDRSTNESTQLTQCRRDAFLSHADFPEWVNQDHILLTWADRSELANIQIELLNVNSGNVLQLTDGFEPLADAELSPSRDKMLISGKSLRMYTSDGRLLREITPPRGFDVARAAWSADGRTFAYILGPSGFRCCL